MKKTRNEKRNETSKKSEDRKFPVEKYTVGGYTNHAARVSLSKCQFPSVVTKLIEHKITQLNDNFKGDYSRNIVRFPFTAFPLLIKGVFPYDKQTHGRGCDFLTLYYDHNPIGFIKEDIPRATFTCKNCEKTFEILPFSKVHPITAKNFLFKGIQKILVFLFPKGIHNETVFPVLVNHVCVCGCMDFIQDVI